MVTPRCQSVANKANGYSTKPSGQKFRLVNVSRVTSKNIAVDFDTYNKWYTLLSAVCQTPCQNQGICIEPGRCACPDNYFGVFCEKKKQFCVSPPRLPKNSEIRIQATTCTISCRKGFVFPDRTAVTNMECVDGQWKPTRQEWSVVPDCEREFANNVHLRIYI